MSQMKFSLLPVGAGFTFQGEHYTKTSALLASRSSDGHQRMVPRSATVETGEEQRPSPAVTSLEPAQVRTAFELFYQQIDEAVRQHATDDDSPLPSLLEAARERFLAALRL